MAGERDHDLGMDVDAVALDADGGFEDGARLHLGDLGHDDAEAVAAQTEHRVGFVQRLDAVEHVFLAAYWPAVSISLRVVQVLQAHFEVSQFGHEVVVAGQELMQRRVQQADDDGVAVHGAEDALEVAALHGQQSVRVRSRGAPCCRP